MSASDPVFYVSILRPGHEASPVQDRITSFNYEDVEKGADKLTLQVDNFDLRHFENPVWRGGVKLEVTWGYPGRMAVPRRVTITKVTGFQMLSVEAQGDEMLLHKEMRTKTFERVRRSDVAKALAEAHGFGPDMQHIEDTKVVLEQITQARMTDAMLLRDMAKREGFQWWIDYDGFHFHRRNLQQQPLKRMVFYTDRRGEILSVALENDIFAKKTGGVTLAGTDPVTKEKFSVQASPQATKADEGLGAVKELLDPATGASLGTEVQRAVASSTVAPTSEATAAAAQRAATGAYSTNQLTAAQLTIECRGDPSLVAKSIIELRGVGRLLEGNYYVTQVTHKIPGGYTMSVKCRRDGNNGAGAGPGGTGVPSKASVNDKTAPGAPQPGAPAAPELLVLNQADGSFTLRDAGGRGGKP